MVVKVKVYESENIHELILDKSVKTIGRSSTCDIKLTDDHVSGKHLAFKKTEQGKVLVKDLGSTNGTFLNQSAISESVLKINDVLTIGPNIRISIDTSGLSGHERNAIEVNDKPVVGITNRKETASEATTVMKINRKKGVNEVQQASADKENSSENSGPVKVGKNITEIDLEESSGMTKLIRIDRKKSTEAKEAKAIVKGRTRAKISKKENPPKSEGLLAKLLSLFSK